MLKVFKRFYQFLFNYKKAFIAFVFVLTIATILQNLTPYIYKLLVDAIPSGNYQFLLKLIILFACIRIGANLLNTLSFYLGDKALIPAGRDARIKIFRRVQDLDFAFHVNKSTGSLISAFKRGDNAFFSLFHNLNIHVSKIVISSLVVLFFFIQITPSIALLMLLVFVGNTFISWRLIKFNIRKREIFNKVEDRISAIITDNLINYETVKFFAQEKKEEKRLKKEFKDWLDKLWGYANSFRLMDITIGILSNLGMLAILWIVVQKLMMGEISTGDLVMVFSFTTGFYLRFFDLLFSLREIAKDYADIQRYFSILDNEILIKDPKKPVKIKEVKGEIRLEEVTFDYPDGKKGVLKNINLYIKPGNSIAFVGRSGVGKTTIIRLLLRFYDVTKGKILIDGINIRNFTKSQLRSFIGIVPQEPILFNNTIGFNISYGNPRAKKTDIIKATKMANLYNFIESLPLKYKTQVGERGIKLSGGQKQRLAIARMILTNPKIIIFDEATSNLDSESEVLIQNALWKIAKNRTVLIIAHRFSTLRKADKIIVLEESQIAETGSHDELMKKKGLYSYLWHLQFKYETERDIELLE
ncbi:MAG: ABC transporter ATP-binding protein [Candidatus Nealsonbacteria bacterium]|nr:MAG: ABC transporter ATP-binding protein [Candidatus Nealsonbacteria bacterium]